MAKTQNQTNDILKKIYYDPGNQAGLSSTVRLFEEAKKHIPGLKHSEVKEWLSSQLTYSLHKPARRTFRRDRMVSAAINDHFQADLVDMQKFANKNDGMKYILTVIDIFSKFAFAIPLKDKTAKSLKAAFQDLFAYQVPANIMTDNGTEFKNSEVKKFFKENYINHFFSKNKETKAAVCERFNRTIKSRMYKYFTSRGTRRYVDILPSLIRAYNESYHSTIKMRPIDVTEENSSQVFFNQYGFKSYRAMLESKNPKPKVAVGQKVRLKNDVSMMDKRFYPNWSEQVYSVAKTIKGNKRPLVMVNDYSKKELPKRFYPEEIQKITEGPYRIEKILKRKDGKVFVRWLGYSEDYDSWEPEDNIKNVGPET